MIGNRVVGSDFLEVACVRFRLGVMYANGQGVAKDYTEALKWVRLAVEQGHARALKWYRKAAKRGDATAQYNLGEMYERGQGVTQNNAEAIKWYRKAAKQGSAFAENALRMMK